jgi:hypothetical protein
MNVYEYSRDMDLLFVYKSKYIAKVIRVNEINFYIKVCIFEKALQLR